MILVHLDMVYSAVFQILASYLLSVTRKENYSSGRQVTGSYYVKGLVYLSELIDLFYNTLLNVYHFSFSFTF